MTSLKADLKVMRALELNGHIETARVSEAQALITLFHTIAEGVRTARRELDDLAATGQLLFASDTAAASRGREHLDAMQTRFSALLAS